MFYSLINNKIYLQVFMVHRPHFQRQLMSGINGSKRSGLPMDRNVKHYGTCIMYISVLYKTKILLCFIIDFRILDPAP